MDRKSTVTNMAYICFCEGLSPLNFSKNNVKCLCWNFQQCGFINNFLRGKKANCLQFAKREMSNNALKSNCYKKNGTCLFLVRHFHHSNLAKTIPNSCVEMYSNANSWKKSCGKNRLTVCKVRKVKWWTTKQLLHKYGKFLLLMRWGAFTTKG